MRWVDCGGLQMARIAEGLTPLLISINARYKVRESGSELTGGTPGAIRGDELPGDPGRIDDCSLWVVERGPADGLPLIVLHGGPGLDHHEFADYLDPVCDDGVRLLAGRPAGAGRSEPPAGAPGRSSGWRKT